MKQIMPVVGSVKCGVYFHACILILKSNPIMRRKTFFSSTKAKCTILILFLALFCFLLPLFETGRRASPPVKVLIYFVLLNKK